MENLFQKLFRKHPEKFSFSISNLKKPSDNSGVVLRTVESVKYNSKGYVSSRFNKPISKFDL